MTGCQYGMESDGRKDEQSASSVHFASFALILINKIVGMAAVGLGGHMLH